VAGPDDEWDAIALNYTSGTTGDPKGVVYHHRGVYLNAIGNTMVWDLGDSPVYLWTLPMFHCNGWCFPWTITAYAGTHVCLRKVDAEKILQLIREVGVTHVRRAHRAERPAERTGRLEAGDRPRDQVHDGRSCTAGPVDRRRRGHGLPADPRLRSHRGLWAGHRVRLAR